MSWAVTVTVLAAARAAVAANYGNSSTSTASPRRANCRGDGDGSGARGEEGGGGEGSGDHGDGGGGNDGGGGAPGIGGGGDGSGCGEGGGGNGGGSASTANLRSPSSRPARLVLVVFMLVPVPRDWPCPFSDAGNSEGPCPSRAKCAICAFICPQPTCPPDIKLVAACAHGTSRVHILSDELEPQKSACAVICALACRRKIVQVGYSSARYLYSAVVCALASFDFIQISHSLRASLHAETQNYPQLHHPKRSRCISTQKTGVQVADTCAGQERRVSNVRLEWRASSCSTRPRVW